jgi:hypothetical protein
VCEREIERERKKQRRQSEGERERDKERVRGQALLIKDNLMITQSNMKMVWLLTLA